MILFFYILREHIAPFLYAFFVITFLFLMDYLLSVIDSIFTKGLGVVDVLHLFVLNMAWMVALSIPMAVLVASLMAYGRLSSDNEITALKAAGIHSFVIILPSLILSGLIGAGLIYFNNRVLPDSNHRAAMLAMDIAQKRPAAAIREGYIIDDFRGYKIIVGRINHLSGEMRDIKIYQEEKGRITLTFARRGEIDYINRGLVLRFTLHDGENHREDVEKPGDYFRTEFTRQVVYIDNVDESMRHTTDQTRGDREMNSGMMLEKVRGFTADRRRETDAIFQTVHADNTTPPKGALPAEFDFARMPAEGYRRCLAAEKQGASLLMRKKYALKNAEQMISKYMVEVHKKYSIPAACPAFVLVGAPLGILARTGGIGVGVVFSLGFFILYWVFLIAGEWMADNMIISPWAAMWAPNLLLLAGGLWLFIRMLQEKEFALTARVAAALRALWDRLVKKFLSGGNRP
jgi:lipopolysaccharide export system permease protein